MELDPGVWILNGNLDLESEILSGVGLDPKIGKSGSKLELGSNFGFGF